MTETFDRRIFIKLGAASAGLTVGCGVGGPAPAPDEVRLAMRYRPLGATGLEVSEIAFGAHGVDNVALMAVALEAGINCFCTSGHYLDGREEEALGKALAGIGTAPHDVVILTGNPVKPSDTAESLLADIDASLRRLRTDHIDIYCNGMVQLPDDVRFEPLFEAFSRARQAGKVGHLALSGHHGGMQACLETGIETGLYEVFFTKYDFVSYPDQDEVLSRARAQGIGTIVFKTNAGGREKEIKDLEAGGLSFRQATLKWALGNPDVASVAVTLTTFDQIRECTAAVGSRVAAAEVAMLRRYAAEMVDRYCRFCAVCEASCPQRVAVADIMRYEMYFTCYGREKEAMRLYDEVPKSHTAAGCDRCSGPCDAACPFGRRVRTGLIEAHRRLDFRRA
jgi:aryl-alcohol dehydrogenase-like predicted oxidoreductase